MQIQYFSDTDTPYIVFNQNPPVETKDMDENTLLDSDENGSLVSLTLEHASARTNIATFSYQQITAPALVHGSHLHPANHSAAKVTA